MLTLEKNCFEFIGIKEQEYMGEPRIDIRVYKRTAKHPEGIPTKQGISIHKTQLEPFTTTLQQALDNSTKSETEHLF